MKKKDRFFFSDSFRNRTDTSYIYIAQKKNYIFVLICENVGKNIFQINGKESIFLFTTLA